MKVPTCCHAFPHLRHREEGRRNQRGQRAGEASEAERDRSAPDEATDAAGVSAGQAGRLGDEDLAHRCGNERQRHGVDAGGEGILGARQRAVGRDHEK